MSKPPKNPVLVEFRLEGEGADGQVVTSPHQVANMATLSDVLRAWSDVVESVARRDKPPAPAEHLVIVRRIESGSPHRVFAEAPRTHLRAISFVSKASGETTQLPPVAVPYMRTFLQLLRKTKSRFHIMGSERAKVREAVLRAPREDSPAAVMQGETTYTGVLVECGGKKPNIHIDAGGPKPIVVNTDKREAKELGAHLYNMIAVDVRARWHSDSAELIDCSLLRWRPGPTRAFADGVKAMSDHHGHVWDGVDVPQWLRKLRGEDDQ